jgi:hypothetical protein
MVAQIAFELGRRNDLIATVIPRAINDAIQIYQKERFRFNELRPLAPFSFNTVQGTYIYDGTFDARIPKLYKIDYLNFLLGNVVSQMHRTTPEAIYLAIQPGQQAGPPSEWAWDGNSIIIYPAAPAQVFPITVLGYMTVDGPTDLDGDTTNPWMNAAERLIRSRAKYEIAVHVTRNKDMAALMSPDIGSGGACERYYGELKGEANKIRGTSRVRAMQF